MKFYNYKDWRLVVYDKVTRVKVWINELKIYGYYEKDNTGTWKLINSDDENLKLCEDFVNKEFGEKPKSIVYPKLFKNYKKEDTD